MIDAADLEALLAEHGTLERVINACPDALEQILPVVVEHIDPGEAGEEVVRLLRQAYRGQQEAAARGLRAVIRFHWPADAPPPPDP